MRPTTRLATLFLSFGLFALNSPTHAADAEIVFLAGKAEFRQSAAAPWVPATLRQEIAVGATVRTGLASQIALVLRDQTQVRLNEQTVLTLTAVDGASQGTRLDLGRGRMWAQAKQFVSGSLRSLTAVVNSLNSERARLLVHTPTATIGIRGTDWEVLADDASTTVTVLSGQVEVSNDAGTILVNQNEQAVALPGKAPTKTILTNARDRVQWVTAYRPAPRRWVPAVPAGLEPAVQAIEAGDYASALALLQPDAVSSAPAEIPGRDTSSREMRSRSVAGARVRSRRIRAR